MSNYRGLERKKKIGTDMVFGILLLIIVGICLSGLRFFVVLSGSMEPKIPTGSLVVIRENNTNIHTGDIVAFWRMGNVVTHRISNKVPEGYKTKGDANQKEDEGILLQDEIIGNYVTHIPYLGYGVFWLRKPVIFFTVIFLILLEVILKQFFLMLKNPAS